MNRNKFHWLIFVVFLIGVAITLAGYSFALKASENLTQNISAGTLEYQDNMTVLIKTNFGDIKLELFKRDAPQTVDNFLKLAKSGFYDGTKFHRVIKNFMIQGGDPNSKDNDLSNDGLGGPGYTFQDEINIHKIVKGVIAMANAGPNTNGSQFFIVTAQNATWLDGKHTVFGKVIEGMETVNKIENVSTGERDHPTKDIVIKSVSLLLD